MDTLNAISSLDLAWAAGLIEGEGSIRIVKTKRQGYVVYVLEVGLGMIDEDIVNVLTGFGGWKVGPLDAGPDRRPFWRWGIASKAAGDLLAALAPYFRSRRVTAKAELAVEFQAQKRLGRHVKGYSERQIDFYERMKVLNLRGTAALARDAHEQLT